MLDEREKYWINFYDSFHNGYNCTIGGEGRSKYNKQEIIEYFKKVNSVTKTAKHFNCHKATVQKAINSVGLNGSPNYEKIIEIYKKTGSIKETAKVVGCSRACVHNACKKNNVKIQRRFNNYKEIADKAVELQSIKQTAKFYKCSEVTVKRALDYYNLHVKGQRPLIKMICSDTGKILKTFENGVDVNRFLGLHPKNSTIHKKCNSKELYHGYY